MQEMGRYTRLTSAWSVWHAVWLWWWLWGGAACHGASAAVFFFPCLPCLFCFLTSFFSEPMYLGSLPYLNPERTYFCLLAVFLSWCALYRIISAIASLISVLPGPCNARRGYRNRGCNPDPYTSILIQHPGSIRLSRGGVARLDVFDVYRFRSQPFPPTGLDPDNSTGNRHHAGK